MYHQLVRVEGGVWQERVRAAVVNQGGDWSVSFVQRGTITDHPNQDWSGSCIHSTHSLFVQRRGVSAAQY